MPAVIIGSAHPLQGDIERAGAKEHGHEDAAGTEVIDGLEEHLFSRADGELGGLPEKRIAHAETVWTGLQLAPHGISPQKRRHTFTVDPDDQLTSLEIGLGGSGRSNRCRKSLGEFAEIVNGVIYQNRHAQAY
jgi:hypothetical protein